MRDLATREKIFAFMRALGRSAKHPAKIYFTGGTTALLIGWRDSTVDIDLRFEPDHDELFRALPILKEKLSVNIELASPPDFIPQLPGWEDRSEFICREGVLDFFNYDLYSQALSKIERGHNQDVTDVNEMIARGFIETRKLIMLFESIEPNLYRYPSIDPISFAKAVDRITKDKL